MTSGIIDRIMTAANECDFYESKIEIYTSETRYWLECQRQSFLSFNRQQYEERGGEEGGGQTGVGRLMTTIVFGRRGGGIAWRTSMYDRLSARASIRRHGKGNERGWQRKKKNIKRKTRKFRRSTCARNANTDSLRCPVHSPFNLFRDSSFASILSP